MNYEYTEEELVGPVYYHGVLVPQCYRASWDDPNDTGTHAWKEGVRDALNSIGEDDGA